MNVIPVSISRRGALLIVAGAVVGLAASLYGYLAPLTGITGTLGALVVSLSSLALVVDGLVLLRVRRRSARAVWFVLGFLGAILTFVAAYFLHSVVLMLAMAVALVGLVVSASRPLPPTLEEAFA